MISGELEGLTEADDDFEWVRVGDFSRHDELC
jgi:hypothetical protein